jgi:SAM-dependent methyltransferase
MDLWKYFDVSHAHHVFCNPLCEAKFDEVIGLIGPALEGREGRLLDIACGKGEYLRRAARRYGCRGVGVELRDPWCSEGRERARAEGLAESLTFVTQDASTYEAPAESVDVASCFGASWIWGGHAGTLAALARWTRPGGVVVVGEPYWIREPSPEYLKAAGLERASFDTHPGNIAIGEQQGLRILHTVVSSTDDWDRYEGLQWYATELHAHAHPEDPDNDDLRARVREHRESYLRWGRDELGWAVYLFLKP